MLNSSWLPTHLTNGAWLPTVGSAVPTSSPSRNPHLTTTPDRLPVVGWYDPSIVPAKLGVARWTGSAWDTRAGVISGDAAPGDAAPAVVVDSRGSIWMAWSEALQTYAWMSNY